MLWHANEKYATKYQSILIKEYTIVERGAKPKEVKENQNWSLESHNVFVQ